MNKYRIIEQLGDGATGEVFRAEVAGAGGFTRAVALKRIQAQHGGERAAELLANEARILSRLRHANIVSVLDFARHDDGRMVLAMELVEGMDLGRLMDSGPLPLGISVYICTELLCGLGYAHDATGKDGEPLRIVHRDVSPANVLIGWDGAVKLTDFGIARAYAERPASQPELKGTPGYMSPDLMNGLELDGRADLFSVGVNLYELLTGRRPFADGTPGQVAVATLLDKIVRPRSLRPAIPEALDNITMRLLERDRERRFSDAHEARDALLRCEQASMRAREELAHLLAARFPRPRKPNAADKRPGARAAASRQRDERAAANGARAAAAHDTPKPVRITKEWRVAQQKEVRGAQQEEVRAAQQDAVQQEFVVFSPAKKRLALLVVGLLSLVGGGFLLWPSSDFSARRPGRRAPERVDILKRTSVDNPAQTRQFWHFSAAR